MKNVYILHERTWGVIFRHVLTWSVFIGYEVSILFIMEIKNGSPLSFFLNYMVGALLFYAHYLILIPLVFERKGSWKIRLLLLFPIEIILYIAFSDVIILAGYGLGLVKRPAGFEMDFYYWALKAYRGIYFCIFSSAYYLVLKALRDQREKMENLVEKQKMENAFLKAQINPHFLFNTLNFIYNEVRKVAPAMGSAIIALSDIMRYSIDTEQGSDEVKVLSEIVEVENFISLHRMRLNYPLSLEFNYDEYNLNGVKIIPLVLITLVENVFKHGNISPGAPPILINIIYDGTDLLIETHNQRKVNQAPSKHIGLANVRKRLIMFYKERASMQAYEDGQHLFHVLLKIKAS